jgi:hypothetical protein
MGQKSNHRQKPAWAGSARQRHKGFFRQAPEEVLVYDPITDTYVPIEETGLVTRERLTRHQRSR